MPPPIRTTFAGRTASRWHTASLVLRRGATTLAAQLGRIVRDEVAREPRTDAGQANQARALIYGAPTMQIAVGDRLTYGAVLYEVTFVRPDRTVETVAEAEAIAILQAAPAPALAGWLPGMATGLIAPPTYAVAYEVTNG